MKFWDSSAIVPLLVEQSHTQAMLKLCGQDKEMLAWWGTEVECVSAIARLEREEKLTQEDTLFAIERLKELKKVWHEVQPIEDIRMTAERLLRVHALRAADALQIAAAFIVCEGRPSGLEFVCLDSRLTLAAQKEGFSVISY